MARQACSRNLSPQVPSEWRSPNFTSAACSAPDCGNNMVAFETCCNGTIVFFNPSSQPAGPNATAAAHLPKRQDQQVGEEDIRFLSCSTDYDTSDWDSLSIEPSPYLDYQNCLLRAGSQYFKCNMPRGETLNDCPVGMQTWPTGDGEITCATENRPNATSALSECCSSEPSVYGYGCYAWCSGSSELQQCIDDNHDRESGPSIFCQFSTNASGSNSGGGMSGGDSDSEANVSDAATATRKTTLLVYLVCGMILMDLLR